MEILKKIGCEKIKLDVKLKLNNEMISFDFVGFINNEPVVGIDKAGNNEKKDIGTLARISNDEKISYYGIFNENNGVEWYQLIGGNISLLKKAPIFQKNKKLDKEKLENWIENIVEMIHKLESISLLEIIIETGKIILFKIELDSKIDIVKDLSPENIINKKFNKKIGKIELREKTLSEIISIFSEIDLRDYEVSTILDAYDKIIFKIRSKSQGESILPEVICDSFRKIFNNYIKKSNSFFDGSAGIGQLLTMVKLINNNISVYGMENNQRILKIANLRFQISNQRVIIKNHDCIDIRSDNYADIPQCFDLILSSPIFGRRIKDKEVLKEYEISDRIAIGEGLYIKLYNKLLKPGGYMGVIVPEGLLTNSRDINIRKFILNNLILKAVISLPEGLYRPYTAIRTSLLILNKKLEGQEEQKDVFMATPEDINSLNEIIEELIRWKGLFT